VFSNQSAGGKYHLYKALIVRLQDSSVTAELAMA
jgi:hypothetical protein